MRKATGRKPASSYRRMMSPIAFFLTASGLMIANVRSVITVLHPPLRLCPSATRSGGIIGRARSDFQGERLGAPAGRLRSEAVRQLGGLEHPAFREDPGHEIGGRHIEGGVEDRDAFGSDRTAAADGRHLLGGSLLDRNLITGRGGQINRRGGSCDVKRHVMC